MKKLTRKLTLSLIAVLFTMMALGTSTYAWYASNTDVTASGMNITAKSNSKYLIIGKIASLDTLQSENKGSVDVSDQVTNYEVLPCAHNEITNKATAATVGNWYTKEADSPDASASGGSANSLTSFADYVVEYTLYITMASGSEAGSDLECTSCTVKKDDSDAEDYAAVRVVVATTDGLAEFNTTGALSSSILASTVTDGAYIEVKVYVYYDGNDTTVYTNNSGNLAGASIELEFKVK